MLQMEGKTDDTKWTSAADTAPMIFQHLYQNVPMENHEVFAWQAVSAGGLINFVNFIFTFIHDVCLTH